jgi:glucosamine--fructose-6-phosphate aminotransferase (isomerizing)
MEDGQMAVMRQDNEGCCEITVFNDKVDDLWQAMALGMISVPDSGEDGRGSQPHFMLKEILEQEKVITGKRFWIQRGYLIRPQEIIILGCGSSYNAALLGRKFIEDYAGIRTSVEYASEFTSRRIGLYASDALFITISQSGETKDVLEAVKHIKTAYTADRILAITNTEHSKLARESGHLLLLNAGLEQGVAATKTFTATIAALVETASRFTYDRMFPRKREAMLSKELPAAIAEVTAPSFKKRIKELADSLSDFENVLFLGRGLHYPTAREAALKLKEVAYVHAEAMPAAEMKHGPIALIDDKTLSVFIVTDTGGGLEKILANVEEIRSRNGQVLVIGDDDFQKGHYLTIPKVDPLIQPILVSVVLQLFAYYVAVKRGCNVDKPRSLAKCVTV